MIISRHAITRYIQRIDRSSADPHQDIKSNLAVAREATDEEIHFIRYTRKNFAKSLKNNIKFGSVDEKFFIHNYVVYCVEDNCVVTLYEAEYLKVLEKGLPPAPEEFIIDSEKPTIADIDEIFRYYENGWKVHLNNSKVPRAMKRENGIIYIKTNSGFIDMSKLHPFKFILKR